MRHKRVSFAERSATALKRHDCHSTRTVWPVDTKSWKSPSFAFSRNNYASLWPFFFFWRRRRRFPVMTVSLYNCDCTEEFAYINSIFYEESSMDTRDTDRRKTSADVFVWVCRANVLTSKGNLKCGGRTEVACCFHDAFVPFLLLLKWFLGVFKVILK